METNQGQRQRSDCFRAETGAQISVESEKATEIVLIQDPSSMMEEKIDLDAIRRQDFHERVAGARDCLRDSQRRYFEAGDHVGSLLRHYKDDGSGQYRLEDVAALLGRWRKPMLSKILKVSRAFRTCGSGQRNERVLAIEMGATWEDCYLSIKKRGDPIDNLRKFLEEKPKSATAKEPDRIENILLAKVGDKSLEHWKRTRYEECLNRYRESRKVIKICKGSMWKVEGINRWLNWNRQDPEQFIEEMCFGKEEVFPETEATEEGQGEVAPQS